MITNSSPIVRASKVAFSHCSPILEEVWFVKVVSTIFLRSNSLDKVLGYFGYHLTPSIALEVIKKLNNPTLGLKFFHFTRERLKMSHSFWTYSLLLRSLCESGLHNSAKLVYDCMRPDGKLPDCRLFGFLVSSYAMAGRLDVSRELLAEAHRDNKAAVNAIVYNNLFSVLVNLKRLDDAVFMLRELMRSHRCLETFTFNILIRGLCRAGEIDEAFRFLDDMIGYGCYPDIVTYNTLIHGLCRINEVDRARGLLEEVILKVDFAPDVVSYTTIISGYCKLSKMEVGTSLFDEMVRSGTKPNTVTFNSLIDGFAKVGDMASALAMYDKMLFDGCPPDVVTFTSLIDGYCRVGQVNCGLDLWREMNARNISANLYTFSVLINSLCKSNRLQEARGLLRILKESDIVPRAFVYNPVIDGYCKSGKVDEANTIVLEMEEKCKPDKITFTILIIGHCMKGRTSEAIEIFYKMVGAGCSPDDVTVRTLSSCLLKAGRPGEAACIKETLFENRSLGTLPGKSCKNTNADVPVMVY